MSRLAVPRLVAAGAVSTASTAVRVGIGWFGLWRRRSPQLVQLAFRTIGAENGGQAEASLRDEVIALLRDSAEISWLEMRRGVDDFDGATRRDHGAGAPSRPFRVKP